MPRDTPTLPLTHPALEPVLTESMFMPLIMPATGAVPDMSMLTLIKPRLQSLYQCLPPAGPTLIPPGPGQLLILILD